VPCIGTKVTGIPEVVRNRQTGFLIPPGDPRRLAHAIREITSSRTDRTALARTARALIERDYDSRRQADQLRELTLKQRRAS
jgi:glycosyltransferase involved in cell wall biosynthesis